METSRGTHGIRPLRGVMRLFITLFIIGFLYSNAAVILSEPARRTTWVKWRVPIPDVLFDVFHVFGVFHSFEEYNQEIVVEGLLVSSAGRGVQHEQWVKLPVEKYLPYPRGERHLRVWAQRRAGGLEGMTQKEAQRFLAGKLRERYNREHPGAPVSRIRILAYAWPRSTAGYEAERKPGKVRHHVWYVE